MKKVLALVLTLMLIGTMSSLWVTAEEEEPVTDGFEFTIEGVDVKVIAESGIICTTQQAYEASGQNWSILILCEKVADNLYRAKQDAEVARGSMPALTLGENDIVIGIHSASSNPDFIDQYKNVLQKNEAMKVKAGTYFTLIDIDLTKAGDVNGKAKVSLSNPNEEPGPAPVQETITIDGKFDDTGWKASGWTHVDSSNATLYANTEGRDDNFDFQFRADDTYLYVALKSNNKPLGTDEIFGNGKGTMFRLWFFTDGFADGDGNEYTTYNYLIDFRYKNGTLDVEARKNNVYNGNKNEVVTIEGLEAAATSSDSYFYVEAAIPFAKIGATTGTHVFVTYSGPTDIDTTVSGNQPTNGSWTYPEVGTYTDDSGEEKISWAYLKWNTENDLDLVFADIKLGVVTEEEPPVVEDPDPVVDLGPEMEEPAYRLVISTDPAVYKPGDTIKVVVTIKDIAADGGLSLIRFKLYYDKDKVEPVIKGDGDQNKDMFAFLKQAPTNWDDSVCKLNEEEGFYDISFLNSSKTGFAVEDNSLVFEIPFTVKSDATGKFAFYIPHNAPGTNGADSNAKKVYGNGGVVIVAKETSTPSTSSTSSSTTTTVPPTGDTGSLAIAVIAMIALAGAATVAVRKRSR